MGVAWGRGYVDNAEEVGHDEPLCYSHMTLVCIYATMSSKERHL